MSQPQANAVLLPDKFAEAFRTLYSAMLNHKVEWAVSGSMALALHELPLIPRDIDIQTDLAAAGQVTELLRPYLVRPPGLQLDAYVVRSHLAQYHIHGVDIEVMSALQYQQDDGSWEDAPDFKTQTLYLERFGVVIPVLSLEYLLDFYTQIQRPARVELIKFKLKSARDSTDPGR